MKSKKFNMSESPNSLRELEFAERTENSLREFSNWLLGISIGIFSLLIFKFGQLEILIPEFTWVYKTVVAYSMIVILLNGLVKYHLLLRTNRLSTHYSSLLKLMLVKRTKTVEELEKECKILYQKWVDEHNKLPNMADFIKLSTIFTAILVVMAGLFIVYVI